MTAMKPLGTPREQLTSVISDVRRRWRHKMALRGGALVVGGVALILLGAALGIDALRFSPGAILGFRLP